MNLFYMVVFDPPHLKTLGEMSWMSKKYGKLPDDWQSLIRKGFEECMRVLKVMVHWFSNGMNLKYLQKMY